MARDFDLGHDRPADVDQHGLHRRRAGRAGRRAGVRPWCCSATPGGRRSCSAGPGWPPTGCCARAPSGRTATPTRSVEAQRHADYAYRLAVDPPAAKELRLFGLARLDDRPLHGPPAPALRAAVPGHPAAGAAGAGAVRAGRGRGQPASCSGRWPTPPPDGRLDLDRVVVFAQVAVGTSMIAFGGLNWALDGAAAPRGGGAAAARRRWPRPARSRPGDRAGRRACRPREIRFRDVTFAYPTSTDRCSTASTSRSRPGRRSPSSARTGRARRRWPSCCAGSTTPRAGRIEVDGVDLRGLDLDAWRSRVTAVFQDFVRFELPLRDNVAPGGAPDEVDPGGAGRRRRRRPGRPRHAAGQGLRGRHRPVGRPVAAGGAGPGAVRGAPRGGRRPARRADRPARRAGRGRDLRPHPGRHPRLHHDPDLAPVLDRAPRRPHLRPRGAAGWSSSARHDELMAAGGRYRTMFDLQASRFGEPSGRRGGRGDL